jgi:hypothetical protein
MDELAARSQKSESAFSREARDAQPLPAGFRRGMGMASGVAFSIFLSHFTLFQ